MTERLDRIERILEVVATQQQVNTQAINQLTADIGGLALQIEQMSRGAEQDRSQAAIDRAEFRTTVQGILDALTQRFNSNGHTEQ